MIYYFDYLDKITDEWYGNNATLVNRIFYTNNSFIKNIINKTLKVNDTIIRIPTMCHIGINLFDRRKPSDFIPSTIEERYIYIPLIRRLS